MGLTLGWMRAHAPYMPIVTAGLLALLRSAGEEATACWEEDGAGLVVLRVETALDADAIGELIASAPWPDEERVVWPGDGRRGRAQGLKPLLRLSDNPLATFRAMAGTTAEGRSSEPTLEQRVLRAIVTDGVVGDDGLPARNRLLSGVKSDLTSAFKRPPRVAAADFARELREGLTFRTDGKGLGLGLVPEVQTFGGSTGPDPSTIDSYSPLLHRLLWHGIIALPPVPVRRGRVRTVGGPLVTSATAISWPRWRVPVDLSGLRTFFSLATIHADTPPLRALARRGVDRVYRAKSVKLSDTVRVFRWGEEVGR